MIDLKKLKNWSKEIYKIASEHGWHEEYKPDGLWMALIMSEIGEAVEADRKNSHTVLPDKDIEYVYEKTKDKECAYTFPFGCTYEACIKGTVEEEFADIAIRLLDFAYMKWGSGIDYSYERMYKPGKYDFAENAWHLCKDILNNGYMDVSNALGYVIDWADDLGINLEKHIEWKIKYNEIRPYRHGNKKY